MGTLYSHCFELSRYESEFIDKRRRQNKRQRELQEIAERIEAKARKYIEESSNEEEEFEENGITRKRYKGQFSLILT